MDATELYDWRLDSRRNGSLYVIGDTKYGNRWETTQVMQMITCTDHYLVLTRNSAYLLYW